MKRSIIQTLIRNLTKPALAALAATAALLAPAPAQAGTGWVHGGNWADNDGNIVGMHYWAGITANTTTAQAAAEADVVASDYTNVGINFVRVAINPATVSNSSLWPVLQSAINELVADGMSVDIGCWYCDVAGNNTITNMTLWENMWKTVNSVYGNNNSVYFEPINEPAGYSLSGLEGVYNSFLGYSWLTKSQSHIILDGTGYSAVVTGVGAAYPNCLLSVHIYPGWGGAVSESDYENELAANIGSYSSRTIITEFGATTVNGKNYLQSNNSDNEISCIRGVVNYCLGQGMGFTYWPATIPYASNGTVDGYLLLNCVGGDVANQSMADELEYGWNVAQYQPKPVAPCVATTSDGRLELFSVGVRNWFYTDYQVAGGGWSGWAAMYTNQAFAEQSVPVVGTNTDGRLELLIVDTTGYINHIWQLSPGSSAATNWSRFTAMTSASVSPLAHLALGTWANGSLDVFAIGTGDNLIHANQTTGGWTDFASLGGATFAQGADIGINNELDGREEAIVIGTGGNLCQNYQTVANGTSWSGWNNLGGSVPSTAHTALGRNSDGRLEIFTIGSGGNACHAWEETANTPGTWSSMANLGGTWATTAKVSVAPDQNGSLEVFILGTDGNLYHNYQLTSGWDGWSALSGASFNQGAMQCVGVDSSIMLHLFAVGTGGNMCGNSEVAPNSATWTGWSNLGGTFH